MLDVFPKHGQTAQVLVRRLLIGTFAIVGVLAVQGLKDGQLAFLIPEHLDIVAGPGRIDGRDGDAVRLGELQVDQGTYADAHGVEGPARGRRGEYQIPAPGPGPGISRNTIMAATNAP